MKIHKNLPEHFFEHCFFDEITNCLYELGNDLDYTIYITNNYQNLPEYGDNVIAILTAGDERGNPPLYAKKVKYVFKHHLNKEKINNVIHMPLPPMKDFNPDYNKGWKERDIDVFFSGHCLDDKGRVLINRSDFYKHAKNLQSILPDKKILIKTTKTWNTGYDIKEYSELMSRSKVILSPHGHHRPECIRFTEGVMAGCAIIACEQPDTQCYKETNYVKIINNNWRDIGKHIRMILSFEKLWEKYHQSNIEAWKNIYSPRSQANKVLNYLKGKK